MTLLALQREFIAEIAADDDALPSSPGMAIYRNAYRARLLDALAVGYERTRRWVGDEAFEAAAAHYILSFPPHSWTLDAFGARFPDLLADLFAGDGEVAELAWLEWHMQQAFAAIDRPELTAARLAAAGLDEADWAGLRFTIAAGFTARAVRHDLATLWHDLADDRGEPTAPDAIAAQQLVVWRKAMQPHFRLLGADEFAVLDLLAGGSSLGEAGAAIPDDGSGAEKLGLWLAGWLGEGLFSDFAVAP